MRTTVTLDPDVRQLLDHAIHRSRSSLKRVVNDAIRRGLQAESNGRPRYEPMVYQSELQPGIDPARFNQLADELEIEQFVEGGRWSSPT